jgi:hypothetical protein
VKLNPAYAIRVGRRDMTAPRLDRVEIGYLYASTIEMGV